MNRCLAKWGILLSAAGAMLLALIWMSRPDPVIRSKPVSFWIEGLKSEDYQVRNAAHNALVAGGETSAPALRKLLRAQDWPFERALESIQRRTRVFYSFDKAAIGRERAASVIAEAGPAASSLAPDLVRALGDENPSVVLETERALRRLGTSTLEALLDGLKDSDSKVRARAAKVLQDIEPPFEKVQAPLLAALSDRAPAVRAQAAQTLAALTTSPLNTGDSIVSLLEDAEGNVRAAAAESLGNLGKHRPTWTETLRARLSDPSPAVRIQSAKAFWKLTREVDPILPALIQALNDETIGWQAAYLIGQIGSPAAPAVPALIAVLKREKVPRPFRTPPSSALALGRIGRAAAPQLIDTLRDKDPRVRVAAAMALGFCGQEAGQAAAELLKLLIDPDIDVRHASALSLSAIGAESREMMPALKEMLSAEDIYIRSAAARILTRLDPSVAWAPAPE